VTALTTRWESGKMENGKVKSGGEMQRFSGH